ncbi:uncharacterized protein [Misgurnus anguillicaudatus]|uniref:uncharacterized protein n=1 Tax=Misgurnus anguillicaudatus TaxID=75329 RepID=UPI003CCF8CF0
MIFCLLLLSVLNGVFGVDGDEVKSVSVMEGDSVTLNTDITEIQKRDQIVWMFGPRETRIAEIYKKSIDMYDSVEIFRNRLTLDSQTGSLIITNIRTTNAGLYKLLIISNRGTSYKRFYVDVKGVFGVDGDEVKSVSVMEGDSVTLHTDIIEIQSRDHILWMFGPQETRLAEIYQERVHMDDSNEIFGERMNLDNQTGSLTITNISITNSGLYKLQIRGNRGNSYKRFIVTAYGKLNIIHRH